MTRSIEITVSGAFLLTVKSTARGYAVINTSFRRNVQQNESPAYAMIDKTLREGQNRIINVGQTLVVPKMTMKVMLEIEDSPPSDSGREEAEAKEPKDD